MNRKKGKTTGSLEFIWDEIDKPFREQYPAVRKRAKARLAKSRKRLPKLTAEQTETIIDMLVQAYNAGHEECYFEFVQPAEHDMLRSRSKAGRASAIARRKKSKRSLVLQTYNEAVRKGKRSDVAWIAEECGVSLSTAKRALNGKRRWPPLTRHW